MVRKLLCFTVAALALIPLVSGCYFKATFDPTVEWDTTPIAQPDGEADIIPEE